MRKNRFNSIPYAPILEVRPAEMVALESLPEKDKDLLLPIMKLRPWVASHELKNSIEKINGAIGSRPALLALGDFDIPDVPRPVHQELLRLSNPNNGFEEWCQYFSRAGHENFIPCAQLTAPGEFDLQVSRLVSLGRGLGIVVEPDAVQYAEAIALRLKKYDGVCDIFIVLDLGKQGHRIISKVSENTRILNAIGSLLQGAVLSISASSFPDGFVGIDDQEIFERDAFDIISRSVNFPLIYSDRGSARAERQTGGGGTPAPRIDYATDKKWHFFRSTSSGDRFSQYTKMALSLMDEDFWDPNLRIWGTQMIERTAIGDKTAISSPPRATAARINIHLHRQIHYGDTVGLYDTEDEWVD